MSFKFSLLYDINPFDAFEAKVQTYLVSPGSVLVWRCVHLSMCIRGQQSVTTCPNICRGKAPQGGAVAQPFSGSKVFIAHHAPLNKMFSVSY